MKASGKSFWKSKGFWGAVVTTLLTAWNTMGVDQFGLPAVPEFVYAILAGWGLYARVVAEGPLTR
jgi:hypothetical protein